MFYQNLTPDNLPDDRGDNFINHPPIDAEASEEG